MELWIRSQDKERLTTVNDLRIYYSKDDNVWVIEDCDDLAIYKTKERALEVLDEIQEILKPKVILKSNGGAYTTGDNNLHLVNPTYETMEQINIYVYEMPKE